MAAGRTRAPGCPSEIPGYAHPPECRSARRRCHPQHSHVRSVSQGSARRTHHTSHETSCQCSRPRSPSHFHPSPLRARTRHEVVSLPGEAHTHKGEEGRRQRVGWWARPRRQPGAIGSTEAPCTTARSQGAGRGVARLPSATAGKWDKASPPSWALVAERPAVAAHQFPHPQPTQGAESCRGSPRCQAGERPNPWLAPTHRALSQHPGAQSQAHAHCTMRGRMPGKRGG